MSDKRLRELERAFRESGAVDDEAAWLRERVRVGELSQEKLELAATFGYPIPASVLTSAARVTRPGVAEACFLLERLGRDPLFRTALALARLSASQGETSSAGDKAIEAIEVAIACFCKRHVDAVEFAGDQLLDEEQCLTIWNATRIFWAYESEVFNSRLGEAAEALQKSVGEAGVYACLLAEVITWLLGYGDPVRMRVAKRAVVEVKPEDLGL